MKIKQILPILMATSALLMFQGSASANTHSKFKNTRLKTFKNIKYINQANPKPHKNNNQNNNSNSSKNNTNNNNNNSSSNNNNDNTIDGINNAFQNSQKKMNNRQPKIINRPKQPNRKKINKSSHKINHRPSRPISHFKIHKHNIIHHRHKSTRVIKAYRYTNTKMPRLKRILSFPDAFDGGRFPQSINLDKRRHNLYLGFDSYHSNGSKIVKYNLRTHSLRAGKTFGGGHAQGVSLNPKTNGLWLIDKDKDNCGDDHAGLMNHGRFVEVSTKTLKPIYHRYFHVKKFSLGNTLAFAKHHGVFNVIRSDRTFSFYHSPYLNQHGSKWRELKTVIKQLPKNLVIESMAYNPQTKRLYVESETPNRIWSIPLKKLLNNTLVRKDLHIAKLTPWQEPEGLTFTRSGFAYLMFAHYHPWIASIYKTVKPVLL